MESRDKLLAFDEDNHRYTYLPTGESFTSGTTFLHKYFPPFDAEAVVNNLLRKGLPSAYAGMTKEEILARWKQVGEQASAQGTLMHSRIEQTLLGNVSVEWSGQSKEQAQVTVALTELRKEGWQPYRTEWRIFTERYRIAGTLDALFKKEGEEEFLLVDWKRSKEIKMQNRWRKARAPIDYLPDCNYVQYSLQLNLYRWILANHYGIEVNSMRLYSFHPEQEHYQKFPVNIMTKEIELLLTHGES